MVNFTNNSLSVTLPLALGGGVATVQEAWARARAFVSQANRHVDAAVAKVHRAVYRLRRAELTMEAEVVEDRRRALWAARKEEEAAEQGAAYAATALSAVASAAAAAEKMATREANIRRLLVEADRVAQARRQSAERTRDRSTPVEKSLDSRTGMGYRPGVADLARAWGARRTW